MILFIPPDVPEGLHIGGGRELPYQGAVFGTQWSLRIVRSPATDPAEDEAFLKRILQACQTTLALIDSQMSLWSPQSDIVRFNALPAGEICALPPPFSIVTQKAIAIAHETGCAFYPGLYDAVAQWGFGAISPQDPIASGLAFAARHASKLPTLPEMAGNRLAKPAGFAFDLNGIAKGYAVDLLCDVIRHHPEAIACFVEIGGEAKGYGTRPDGMPFWTDIAPDGDTGFPPYRCALYDWACATSGEAERCHHSGAGSFSHILDPRTLAPAQTDLIAATVFDKSCARADALATALVVMGSDDALAFADAGSVPCILTLRNPGSPVFSRTMHDWINHE